jgi:hypothetical protein
MKRKVTDLLPNEAILISNDADLKVLEEFEKAGVIWYGSKHKPTEWTPIMADFTFPFVIVSTSQGLAQTCEVSKYRHYPATNFIGSEGESVEADEHKPFDVEVYSEDKFVIYTTERDDMGEKVMCANIVTRSRLIEIVEKMQSLLIKTNP